MPAGHRHQCSLHLWRTYTRKEVATNENNYHVYADISCMLRWLATIPTTPVDIFDGIPVLCQSRSRGLFLVYPTVKESLESMKSTWTRGYCWVWLEGTLSTDSWPLLKVSFLMVFASNCTFFPIWTSWISSAQEQISGEEQVGLVSCWSKREAGTTLTRGFRENLLDLASPVA